MKIIKPSFEILTKIDRNIILNNIELAGRTCYKSEAKITKTSSRKFVKNIIKLGHESVIEHQNVSVKVVCDRGVAFEIVRHRISSFSMESTRYVNYSKSDELVFIKPCFFPKIPLGSLVRSQLHKIAMRSADKQVAVHCWLMSLKESEECYLEMLKCGCTPQEARSVLPNSLKTELVITMNLRSWRNFFNLRALGTHGKPHPQMLEIAIPMLKAFKKAVPIVFDDLAEALLSKEKK